MTAALAAPATTGPTPAAGRLIRCRYLAAGKRGSLDRCTAEAVDPEGEILLCAGHLAEAMAMLTRLFDTATAQD